MRKISFFYSFKEDLPSFNFNKKSYLDKKNISKSHKNFIWNFLLNEKNFKVTILNSIDGLEICIGNLINGYVNLYTSIEHLIDHINQKNIEIELPEDYESRILKLKNTKSTFDSQSLLLSPDFKSKLFIEICNSKKISVTKKYSIKPIKKKLTEISIFQKTFTYCYFLIISLILFFFKIRYVFGIKYSTNFMLKKIKNFFLLNIDFVHINYLFLNSLNFSKKLIISDNPILNNLNEILPGIYFHDYNELVNNKYFNIFSKKINLLSTDSFFHDNDFFKILSLLFYRRSKKKILIKSHGGSFFYDSSSWIFNNCKYFKYIGNGNLESKFFFPSSIFRSELTRQNKNIAFVIYLYPFYQHVRVLPTKLVRKLYYQDLNFLLNNILSNSNSKIILKPHRNNLVSQNDLFDIEKLVNINKKRISVSNDRFEDLISIAKLNIFTYFSTGWLESINAGIKSICFNPNYMEINIDQEFKFEINNSKLSNVYFENFKSFNYNRFSYPEINKNLIKKLFFSNQDCNHLINSIIKANEME